MDFGGDNQKDDRITTLLEKPNSNNILRNTDPIQSDQNEGDDVQSDMSYMMRGVESSQT